MLVKQRRFDEALPVLTDALRVMRASGWAEGIAMIELQLGRIQVERGDFAAADQTLERVTADFAHLGKPVYALEAAAARANGLHRAGQSALALELLDGAIASAARSDSASMRPILACTRALACAALGRVDEAEREITAGLAAAREQNQPYEEALLLQARCDIARHANRLPDPEDAKAAEQIFGGLGVR
jgi:tetratricopeptide (TPR) repeat protein